MPKHFCLALEKAIAAPLPQRPTLRFRVFRVKGTAVCMPT